MKTFAFLILAMLGTLLVPGTRIAVANNKPASLPPAVLSAKSIFVENQTSDAQLQNSAYTELTKWGRFQIVDAPEKADVVLRLSNGNHVRSVSAEELDARLASKSPEEDAVPAGFIRITLVEAKTGNSLWSDQKKSKGTLPPRGMLENLRSTIAVQEKSHPAK
jgi:hypothetical protein